MKKFFSLKIKCKSCGDTICSNHGGDFVSCKCFKNEIDNKGICMDRDRWFPERYRIINYEGAEILEEK